MVANASQQGMNASKSYELTQQAKDAKNVAVYIKMNSNGKIQNLEMWRRGIDVMLGLMTATHYTDENNNIYLDDPKQLLMAKAEVQLSYTQTIQVKDDWEETEVIEVEEIVEEDEDEEIDGSNEMFSPPKKDKKFKKVKKEEMDAFKIQAEEESKKPSEQLQSTNEFVNAIIASNMMTSKTTENDDMCIYVNSMLCIHHMKMNERAKEHLTRLGYSRLYVVKRRMRDGSYENHHAPLEDFFLKRKRTLVYNLIIDTMKEIKSFLYHHIKFGDIASLITWVTETYGIDRRADRIRTHFKKFKTLSSDYETKNFDTWLARAIGYLANDISLSLGTPAIFVKLQLQEGVDKSGSEELKKAWHEAENNLIIANKKAQTSNEIFSQEDVQDFLADVKTRFHTYSTHDSRRDRQKRVNVNVVNHGNGNQRNEQRNNNRNQNGRYHNTNENTNDRQRICAFHNMMYGCNKTECKYDHAVVMDEEKRSKLIEVSSKGGRCCCCGISGHEKKDCKKKEEMKKILTDRKKKDKKAIRRAKKNDSEDQEEGKVKNEEDDDEDN